MTETMAQTLIQIAATYLTDKGCYLRIEGPTGYYIDTIYVKNVYDVGVFHGLSLDSGIETAYDITDGIQVTFIENPNNIFQCQAYDIANKQMLSYHAIKQYCLQDLLSNPNLKLRPYTGIYDFNNKQIYQGDILALTLTDDVYQSFFLSDSMTDFLKKHQIQTLCLYIDSNVTTLKTRYYLYFQTTKGNYLTYQNSKKIRYEIHDDMIDYLTEFCSNGGTIIGNIYETPDLCPITKLLDF